MLVINKRGELKFANTKLENKRGELTPNQNKFSSGQEFAKTAGERGQAIILILLFVAIGLTVVSSVSTRSLREYRETSYATQYSQAASMAEAGLEEALGRESFLESAFGTARQGWEGVDSTLESGSYRYQVKTLYGGGEAYVTAKKIEENEVVEIRLGDFDCSSGSRLQFYPPFSGTITISWDGSAEIETRIYKVTADCKVVLDRDVKTSPASVTLDGSAEILRIRPIGEGAKISITSSSDLPVSQAVRVTSIGSSGQATVNLTEEVSRPFLPPIFDYLLFSGTGINK